MATGIKRLQRLQMGPEVTPGTAVAATAVWRGAGNQMSDDMVIEEIEEMVGILDGTDRTAIVQLMAGIELSETPLTFEHLPYLLAMGFGGGEVIKAPEGMEGMQSMLQMATDPWLNGILALLCGAYLYWGWMENRRG